MMPRRGTGQLAKLSLVTLACSLLLARYALPARAAEPDSVYLPGAAESAAQSHLASARLALQDLQTLPPGVDRETAYVTALNALSALDQVFGCEWAKPKLAELYRQPDCPEMHVGWSADGRIALRIEPLQLKNPAFKDWRIYLLTLQGETSLDTFAPQAGLLRFQLSNGQEVSASALSPQHPLWQNLDRLDGSFHPPAAVPSGANIAFKQIFSLADLSKGSIERARFSWGSYSFDIGYYREQ